MNIRGAPAAYDDLSAVYVNCTLKRSPTMSHTQFLLDHSAAIMTEAGASVTQIRAVDHAHLAGREVVGRHHGRRAPLLVVG